ncbi:hypothetical protein ANN_00961 [Periplaneta americana]|uniref:Uncharacterized protein n=1 Tax=Periplaneta americana TaxID=6978 RepID=A0ABQ8TS78_PERAM|nr:hypothetical protein ANN_00961 [Periplaneta americana]
MSWQDFYSWKVKFRTTIRNTHISPAMDDNTPDEDEVSSAELDNDCVSIKMKPGCLFDTSRQSKHIEENILLLVG